MKVSEISKLPLTPGIYKFKNSDGDIIYVGKSVRLRDRVKSYFSISAQSLGEKTRKLVSEIKSVDVIETESEIEALILEAELVRKHQPKYNVQLKDDKRYKYVRIVNAEYRHKKGIKKTIEEGRWPAVTTSRDTNDPDSLYFGPFPKASTVTFILKTLRKIFPYCKYSNGNQAKKAKRACFYSHIGLCPGICGEEITLREYWKIIDQLVWFLKGRKHKVQKYYQSEMKKSSIAQNYEQAADYRDTLEKIEYITQQFHDANDYIENPNLREDIRLEELKQLVSTLGLKTPGDELNSLRIEGYDISNLGKDYTVGSRVTFIGGESDKSEYRRYKIKHDKLPDDFAAMTEVILRRTKNKNDLPDLFLIDGGQGQLSAVLGVLKMRKLKIPAVGLAKKEEILVVPDGNSYREIKLKKTSPAVKLVMRVRDESHRFAQAYHKLLRKKALVSRK